MKVRDGQLAGLQEHALRCVRDTSEKDTKTLRYDWFVSSDGTECESREAYIDSEGLIEHRVKNVAEATNELLRNYGEDPLVSVYGAASPGLKEFARARMETR